MVASETGHVYTFATPKLQPMITSEAGKALIQTCLHQPDLPSAVTGPAEHYDTRMSASGFEETDLNNSYHQGSGAGNKVHVRCTIDTCMWMYMYNVHVCVVHVADCCLCGEPLF